MRAFHGDPKVKAEYLKRVRAHRAADQIIHGTYWKDGKGCAVGCTVHSSSHAAYETELGIPRLLARLEDGIFEALGNGQATEWPEQFLDAISVGADLSLVWPQFAIWMLTDETWGVLQFAKSDLAKRAIIAVSDAYRKVVSGEKVDFGVWRDLSASAAAASAAAAAYADADAAYAAAYAAYASAYADAAYASADAASAAADAYAASAADAAYDAAADAAYAAAAAAADADAVAKSKWREAHADKLLALLRGAPVPQLKEAE